MSANPLPLNGQLPTHSDSENLLVTAEQAAKMCGKSLRTWRSWDAAGWIPKHSDTDRTPSGNICETSQRSYVFIELRAEVIRVG